MIDRKDIKIQKTVDALSKQLSNELGIPCGYKYGMDKNKDGIGWIICIFSDTSSELFPKEYHGLPVVVQGIPFAC